LRYRKAYSIKVIDVNFEDKSPAEGLPAFDNGTILPKMILSSIELALRWHYSFSDHHYNFDKAMLSKSLGKPYRKE
jgi:hypothetical protein